MAQDIIIGRSKKEKEELGKRGLLYLGKSYVKMENEVSLSNNVYLDVNKSHVILIAGKRGSGKSYSISVIAEEMSKLDEETRNRISVIIIDTMGIFWSMKYPNEKQKDEVREWGMEERGFDVKVFVPKGKFKEYQERGISVDYSFSFRPGDLRAEDWCNVFNVDITSPIGVLIERAIGKLEGNYDIGDILSFIEHDDKADHHTKYALINRFEAAKTLGIFDEEGINLKDFVIPGKSVILDVSCYEDWNVKNLVVGLLGKKLLSERVDERKKEEIEDITNSGSLYNEEKKQSPLIWLMIDECVTGDTEVITSTNHTSIEKVVEKFEIGEDVKVLSYDKDKKEYVHKKVTKVYKIPKREIIKIKTECGREIKCTPDHPLLTREGYISAVSVQNIAFPLVQHYSEDEECLKSRLLGYLFGDGWLCKNKSVGFSGKSSKNDLVKIKKNLSMLNILSSNIHTRKTSSTITDEFGNSYEVNGESNDVTLSMKGFEFFYNLGAPVGQKVLQETFIPDWIVRGKDRIKCEFLAGLMGADGARMSPVKKVKGDFNPIRLSFNKDVRLKKNAIEFANQIKGLFESVGVKVNSIYQRSGNIRKDDVKTLKIQITLSHAVENTIRFLEKVGYRYCEDKETQGLLWLEYLRSREYERKKRIIIQNKALKLKSFGYGKVRISKILGIKEYEAREYIYSKHKRGVPKSFDSFNDWIRKRISDCFLFESVESVQDSGVEDVYDISVEGTHNFIANSLISHNCQEFLPRTEKTAASDALTRLLKEGRQPGISMILATQQPGEIHKDVMTQSDIVISHRITAQFDIEALNSIMQTYLSEDILSYINDLPSSKGSAIILDDNNERIFSIKVRPKMSWHGGDAPSAVKIEKKLFES